MSEPFLGMGPKREIIRDHLQRHGLRVMVETGLYNGDGSGFAMLDILDRLVVIDSQEENVNHARRRFPEAELWCGDSATLMPHVLNGLDAPALFWLDAHEWVGDEFGPEPAPSPLLAELAAIVAWPHAARSVVLVDDVRQFADGSSPQPGWPSMTNIVPIACKVWWTPRVEDDVLRLTP